jgi:hypothetical protein
VISNGAGVRLDDVTVSESSVTDAGGGLHLEIRGGSQLVIANSKIFSNAANSGGGFDIALYDGSQLIIEDTTVVSNTAGAGYGGGGRIRIMNSGHISITNSRFENNTGAFGGNSLAIETEPGASGEVWLLDSEIEASDIYTSGDGVLAIHDLTQKLYLPVTMKNPVNNALAARITSIVISNTNYVVDFETDNYTPSLPGQHVHFFFNTVPPDQAGAPGSGPWKVYGGSSPFTDYNVIDRPVGAWQMCILVANQNHSVQAGSGNCVDLP